MTADTGFSWDNTVPVGPEWPDTIPIGEGVRPPARGPRRPAGTARWRLALGGVLWFVSLTLGLLVTAVVSALALDSQAGLYGDLSVEAMVAAGELSLACAGATLAGIGLAALLVPVFRPRALVVSYQLVAMTFLGVPWLVLTTALEFKLQVSTAGGSTAVGGLVFLVLWARLQSRCWPRFS